VRADTIASETNRGCIMGLFDGPTETRTFTFAEHVTLIELRLDAAEVFVTASDDETVRVEIETSKSSSGTPESVPELVGTRLRLESGIVERVNSRRRMVVRITAPREVALDAKVNACRMQVTGRASSDGLNISADAGSIKLEDITGNVTLRGNAVKVELAQHQGQP